MKKWNTSAKGGKFISDTNQLLPRIYVWKKRNRLSLIIYKPLFIHNNKLLLKRDANTVTRRLRFSQLFMIFENFSLFFFYFSYFFDHCENATCVCFHNCFLTDFNVSKNFSAQTNLFGFFPSFYTHFLSPTFWRCVSEISNQNRFQLWKKIR